MSDMVERVARALCEAEGIDPDTLVYRGQPLLVRGGRAYAARREAEAIPCWLLYCDQAQAAVVALRDVPSKEAVKLARLVYLDPAARARFISLFNSADMPSIQESAMAEFIRAVMRAALADPQSQPNEALK